MTANNDLATFTIGHPDDGKSTVKTIQLQVIGLVKATEAVNLKVGDVTVWNFGATEKVIDILKPTTAFVNIVIENVRTGTVGTRRLKKTRLVGIK